jgi:hypothetical protein
MKDDWSVCTIVGAVLRHGNVSQIDALPLSCGPLTENEFGNKSKPESCRPCASDALDHALQAKDEWGVARLWVVCRVMGIDSQNDAIRFSGGRLTEIEFR